MKVSRVVTTAAVAAAIIAAGACGDNGGTKKDDKPTTSVTAPSTTAAGGLASQLGGNSEPQPVEGDHFQLQAPAGATVVTATGGPAAVEVEMPSLPAVAQVFLAPVTTPADIEAVFTSAAKDVVGTSSAQVVADETVTVGEATGRYGDISLDGGAKRVQVLTLPTSDGRVATLVALSAGGVDDTSVVALVESFTTS